MASLGQMVAGVAHEINTPLGYVRNNNLGLARGMFGQMQEMVRTYEGFLAMLMSGTADEESVRDRLAAVMAAKEAFDAGYSAEDVEVLFEDTDYGIGQISEIVLNLKNLSRLDQAPVDDVDLNECLDSALLIARNVLKHKAEVIKVYGRLPRVSCAPSQINQVFLNLLTNAAQAIES
jgi:two-component system NtrC family sensor kinase